MNLNAPEIKEKLTEWQDELRRMTGNFRVALAAHIEPILSNELDGVIGVVCEETGVEIGRIRTKTRKREVVIARQLLVYYGRLWCGLSYSELGGLIGGRDHTTAIHSRATIEDLIDSKDEAVCYLVKRINKRLEDRNQNNSA